MTYLWKTTCIQVPLCDSSLVHIHVMLYRRERGRGGDWR